MASNPFRIALVADIHANVWALEAVLNDIGRRQVDAVFNLGDILHGVLKPRETYDRLKAFEPMLTIRGNQDRQLYEATPEDRRNDPKLAYMLDDLGAEPVEWLRSLPPTATFEEEIFLCHGTPESDDQYLLEDVATGRPMVRADSEIVRLVSRVRHPMIACGHTHIPRLVRLAGGQLIVNPGSVGLPAYSDDAPVAHAMESYSPHAAYAIVSRVTGGWDVEFHRVAYDWERAAKLAGFLGRADWERQIRTGRV